MDIIGKLTRMSPLREFTFHSQWTDKIETKEIINLWIETTTMEYGEEIPSEEQVVLFGKEAVRASETFKQYNQEGVKKLKEFNLYCKDCNRSQNKHGETYSSWAGKKFKEITKAKRLNMLKHFHATPTAA